MIMFLLAIAANVLLLALAATFLVDLAPLASGFEIGVMTLWLIAPLLSLWVLLWPSTFWKHRTLRRQRLLLEEKQRLNQLRRSPHPDRSEPETSERSGARRRIDRVETLIEDGLSRLR